MPLLIPTERLLLRRFRKADRAALLALVQEPSVGRVTAETIEATPAGVRSYIIAHRFLEPFAMNAVYDLAVELKSAQQLIGLVTLVRRDFRQAEIGWALAEAHRRRGYATEAAAALITYALTSLDTHRVFARTSSANKPSWQVMERLGLRREGHLRETEFHDGRWDDTYIYAILEAEWKRQGASERVSE